MPGLGVSFGRGAMTNHWIDLKNSDCILVMGSNPAENHPCGFKWAIKAKEKGAKIISVDPRFTRSSSVADIYAPMRPGTDIAILGGLINYAIENNLYHKEYVLEFTNAATLIDTQFGFMDGLFTGFDKEKKTYDRATWKHQTGPDGKVMEDRKLQHPHCVFQLLKRHFSRYTADMVSKISGMPKEKFLEIAKLFCSTGAPDKVGTMMYAMGWTQHSKGVQNIRTAAILQLLLGNVGMPGGGINALRGHINVQGATDFALLYHDLPGYLGIPSKKDHPTLKDYLEKTTPKTGFGSNKAKFFKSLLKAWYGNAATDKNDFCYDYLPKASGNYSHMALFEDMYAGKIKGFLVVGQNPAVAGPNGNLERKAMEKLEWLAVIDFYETETAAFWKAPGVNPKDIKTEVFLLPAASNVEREGTYTNSGRWAQWGFKAIESEADRRTDGWYVYQLGLRLKKLYAESKEKKDRPILDLTLDYGEGTPDAERILREINGYAIKDVKKDGKVVVKAGENMPGFALLQDDGSTACGNWIYSGIFPKENKSKNRKPDKGDTIGANLGWAFAWPANRRIIYNRASADANGKPWSEAKKYITWDPNAELPDGKKGKWVGPDVPDFKADLAPTAKKEEKGPFIGIGGRDAFIMRPDGKGGLFSPLAEGPFPEHYEPVESPVKNLLSPIQFNPVVKIWASDMDKLGDANKYPIVGTTYRLAEHYLSGSASRNLPWLCELMPELFVELSPELATEKGIKTGDNCTIETARGKVKAKALITVRFKPLNLDGKKVHLIGLPWHWGYMGICTGDIVNNLTAHIGDPNTFIQETKAFLCDIRKGG